MAKPIIKTISPFDATTPKVVSFVWTGAMAYSNRMLIYDSDERIIFDETYPEHYLLNHTIPAGTLVNGRTYSTQISVLTADGSESAFSDKYYFSTTEMPNFYFSGLDPDSANIINSSSYTANLHYDQPEGVEIASYQFFLLSSTKEILDSSEIMHDPRGLSYTYRSLENDTSYYIRATGFNAKNVEISTGDVLIIASYIKPSTYGLMFADPNSITGTVDYHSNIVYIDSDIPASGYEFDEGFIDLNTQSVRYSKNFIIPDENATVSVRMRDAYKTQEVLRLQVGQTDTVVLSSIIYDDESLRYKLVVYGPLSDYIIYSEPLIFDSWDIITVHIRRVNGVYGLYVFVTENQPDPPRNYWFMEGEPLVDRTEEGDIWINKQYKNTWISKDVMVRYYQDDEPTDIDDQNVWIGN